MEKISKLEIEDAYNELRNILIIKGCKILEEDAPRKIRVIHGKYTLFPSINIKKEVKFEVIKMENKTKINVKYEIPKYIKIMDLVIFPLIIILFFIFYFMTLYFINIFKESLPEIPTQSSPIGAPSFSIEDLLGFFYWLATGMLIGGIIFIILFPTILIKYKRAEKFINEILSLIR